MDGLSTTGQHQWSYVEHRDYEEGHWLSVFGSGVVLQDDGEPLDNPSTGALIKWLANSFDSWGETIPDATGLYGANTFLADGADLYVYAYSTSNALLWKALQQKSTKYSSDGDGGLLLVNGTLYYAADYTDPSPNASGIYALNAASGAKIGYVATTPTSEMSADANNIYLIENSSTLVARSQSTLAKLWSVNLTFGSTAAPVIADGMVIVATYNSVAAFDPASGHNIWTTNVQPVYSGQYSTAMCAALVSNTLVVTSFDGVHLLNIANGADTWHGSVAGASNPIIVNDPAVGATVYVTDGTGVIALVPLSSSR
ncbi:MAG: PQQ-binding-like beta-propeller repeat protein [Candidatus Eremiobacteraeota bacterium]|nr:PQQ-binding-like beta-propeller repeat protein [Candidatus Eremiobacteraeota bacterium]